MDQITGGKWFIHGPKHHKDNQWQSLKHQQKLMQYYQHFWLTCMGELLQISVVANLSVNFLMMDAYSQVSIIMMLVCCMETLIQRTEEDYYRCSLFLYVFDKNYFYVSILANYVTNDFKVVIFHAYTAAK